MSWPMSQDFNEAIQNPKLAFGDQDLATGEPVVGAHGLPLPRSGNFADVYQLRGADGQEWAVKCFTRPVTGLGDRYAAISEALAEASFPFSVAFEFQAEGIKVGGVGRPVVKMEWVEGLLLNQVVRENAGSPKVLAALGQMWVKLCKRLREAGVAHADLQHGNVLLVPGSRPGTYGLKLIDYDGMYVPALANTPSGEAGHPSFQHPARAATRAYSQDVDRFPHLVVATALKALETGGSAMWERYDNGDNLLFTENDYKNPATSKVMRELWLTENPTIQSLVGRLANACSRPIPQTPWLDQLAPDGEIPPLDNEARRDAASALGIALPVPTSLPLKPSFELVEKSLPPNIRPAASASSHLTTGEVAQDDDNSDIQPRGTPRLKKQKKRKSKSPQDEPRSDTRPFLFIGGLLLVGGIVVGVVLAGGKQKTSEIVQQKPEEPTDSSPQTVTETPKPKDRTLIPVTPKPKDNGPGSLMIRPASPREVSLSWTTNLPADFVVGRLPFLSSDSRTAILISGARGATTVLDAGTGKLIPTEFDPPQGFWELRPLNESQFAIVSNTGTGTISVLTPRTGRSNQLTPVTLNAARLSHFVSPDSRYVAAGAIAPNDELQPFKLKTVADEKTILDLTWVRGNVSFTADSSRVLIAESNGRCRWFKLPSGESDGEWTLQLAKGKLGLQMFASSADGSVLLSDCALSGHDESYHVIDGRTGRIVCSLPGRFLPQSGSLTADGSLALLTKQGTDSKTRIAEVVHTGTGAVIAEVAPPEGSDYLRARILPDGSGVIALAGPGPKVIRFDFVAPGTKPKDPPGPKDPDVKEPPLSPGEPLALKSRWNTTLESAKATCQLHIEPDANVVLVGSSSGFAAIDLKTGNTRAGFTGLSSGVSDFFSMEGARVGTLGAKGEVRVWDAKTGREVTRHTIPEIPAGVGDAVALRAFLAPNGKYLAVGRIGAPAANYSDVPLQVFDVGAKKPALMLEWKGGSIHFTADSSRILVAEWSGRFRWFKLPSGEPDGDWEADPPQPGRIHQVTGASTDGLVLGYTGWAAEKIKGSGAAVMDGKTGKLIRVFGRDYFPTSPLAVQADGKRVALIRQVGPGGTAIDVIDVASGARVGRARLGPGQSIPSFNLSADGRVLAVHDPTTNKVEVFDVPPP